MPVVYRTGVGLSGIILVLVFAGCRSVPANQALATPLTTPTFERSVQVRWGRVPYCNCLADSATTKVADALMHAKLAVSLKELSPRDGWLYFAVTFDPQAATGEQVETAMLAGGAEVLEGPP